jgi:APA family basic amino acid/polyamine antiporter
LLALGIKAPVWFNNYSIFGMNASPMAAGFIVVLTIIQNRGSKSAGKFNNIMTITKLIILLFITVISFSYFKADNFTPFFVEGKGFEGVIESATILFFGYLGFDFMTTVTEEAINPIKDVPKAILYSILISGLIYATVSFSISGVGNLAAGHGDGETALADIF